MTDNDDLRERESDHFTRIRQRVLISEAGCWEWQGSRNTKGYGQMQYNGRRTFVHRVVFLARGIPIPDGMHIDHLCRNPCCCNPDHLEIVTPGENTRRGNTGQYRRERMALVTHCPNGHEYTEENTYFRKGKGWRLCKACFRERNKARYELNKSLGLYASATAKERNARLIELGLK